MTIFARTILHAHFEKILLTADCAICQKNDKFCSFVMKLSSPFSPGLLTTIMRVECGCGTAWTQVELAAKKVRCCGSWNAEKKERIVQEFLICIFLTPAKEVWRRIHIGDDITLDSNMSSQMLIATAVFYSWSCSKVRSIKLGKGALARSILWVLLRVPYTLYFSSTWKNNHGKKKRGQNYLQ